MSLSFENNTSFNSMSSSNMSSDPQKSKMVAFLLKKGIVKTESAGNAVLLVFALILIFISGYMMYNTLVPDDTPVPTPEEVLTNQVIESE